MTFDELVDFIAHGMRTVQRALGHAKSTTTLDTYSHLWPTAEDRTRAAAEAMVTETLGKKTEDLALCGLHKPQVP